MKIAYIALKALPYIGGIEKYTEEIGRRLVEDGHKVYVFTTDILNKKPYDYLGMNIIPMSTIKLKGFQRIILSHLAIMRASFMHVDIIHIHGFENSLLTFLPRMFGKKVVLQGHGLEWERDRWSKYGKIYLKMMNYITNKFSFLFFDKATVVSKYQQNYYKFKYKKEYSYIPTGINLAYYKSRNIIIEKFDVLKQPYILFAARLVPEKGAHFLIEAFNKCNLNVTLVIAGDNETEIEYKNQLLELSRGNNKILFVGYVSGDLFNSLMSNANLFILPSTLEGLPITLFEAMSYNVPTLSSDIPPNLEATENSNYGIHFKNKVINDLSKKINFVFTNYEDIKLKSKDAKKYVEKNYTWDNIYQEFKKFYNIN